MDSNGANAKQLTTNKVPEGNASLSPDGQTVMFTSGSNEQFDIYLQRQAVPGPGRRRHRARAAARSAL